MNFETLTFGEYLKIMITHKNLSISKLSIITKTKSRNEIHRLLADLCNISTVENFASKLLSSTELNFTTDEIAEMQQSIEISRSGKDKYVMRHKMLDFVTSNRDVVLPDLDNTLLSHGDHHLSLRSYFNTFSDSSEVEIVIFGSSLFSIIQCFFKLRHNTLIHVQHLFTLGENCMSNATTFIDISKTMNFDTYTPYYCDSSLGMTELIVIKKNDYKRNCWTDLIIRSNNKLHLLLDNPGDDLYDFHLSILQNTDKCQFKKEFGKKELIDEVYELSAWNHAKENQLPLYYIKHNFSTPMIPFYIFVKLVESVNLESIGIAHDDSRIPAILDLFKERCHDYYHRRIDKIHVFTKRGLLDFVSTGYLSDHFAYFRPLTKDEIKEMLQYVLKMMEKNHHFKIYLFEDDTSLGNIGFCYYYDKYLYLFEESAGYDNHYYEAIIDAKQITTMYNDFFRNELLKYHVCPEEVTIAYIKYLIMQL